MPDYGYNFLYRGEPNSFLQYNLCFGGYIFMRAFRSIKLWEDNPCIIHNFIVLSYAYKVRTLRESILTKTLRENIYVFTIFHE